MYDSPITLVQNHINDMRERIDEATGAMVVDACIQVGVQVDRDELIKMAKYDRGQYEKGFKDGMTEGVIETLNGLLSQIESHMENVKSENPMYLLGQQHIRDIVEMVLNEKMEGKNVN